VPRLTSFEPGRGRTLTSHFTSHTEQEHLVDVEPTPPTPPETPDPPVAPVASKPKAPKAPKVPKDRIERYEAVRPDGTVVTVEHNLDKGTTEIVSE